MNGTILVPYVFDERTVRTVTINDVPWFVAVDVCTILGYQNSSDAVHQHIDPEDKGVAKCDTLGGPQTLVIVNESGLYALIFGSHLSEAKRFKRWVTSEVLPSIRKTGRYQIDLRGWVSAGPKPWAKTFPDRFYDELFRLHAKNPQERSRNQEPWLAQVIDRIIYQRLEHGVREALHRVDPIPAGKRRRMRQLHRHITRGEAERQFAQLLGECVGALCAAQSWTQFLALWDSLHPIVSPLPPGISATLDDGEQLWLFRPSQEGGRS